MTDRIPDRRAIVAAAAIVPMALLAGAAVALLNLPVQGLLVLGGIVLALSVLGVIRQPLQPTTILPDIHDECATAPNAFLRSSVFYYAGLLFLPFTIIRPLLGYTLSDWFFVAAFTLTAAGILLAKQRDQVPSLPHPFLWGLALYVIGGLLSSAGALLPGQSVVVVVRAVWLIGGWLWLSIIVLQRPRQVQRALMIWVASAAIAGIAAIAQFLLGDVIPGAAITYGRRMTGVTAHPNEIGAICAAALVPALYCAVYVGRGFRMTLISWGAFAAVIAGLLLSSSVGSVIGATVGIIFWVAVVRIPPRLLVLGGCAIAGALWFMQVQEAVGVPSLVERFASTTGPVGDPNATLWGRVDTYHSALARIAMNPLVGVGMDPVSQLTTTGYEVHNLALASWYEAGIVGFAGVLILLAASGFVCFQTIRRARSSHEWFLAVSLTASFITVQAYALSSPILLQRYAWVPVALLLAIYVQQHQAAPSDFIASRYRAAASAPNEQSHRSVVQSNGR